MNTLTAFLTGLSTGGLTCLAVQGGLLLALLAKDADGSTNGEGLRVRRLVLPVLAFLIAKITIYTLFGVLLGMLGAKIQLSLSVRITLQVLAAIIMVIAGIRLVKPQFLPWINWTAPASVRRFVRQRTKQPSLLAPALLGFATILIPCGTTIAMEAAAIATGSPIQAASILFAFTLGTAPLFFLVGILAKGIGLFQRKLNWVTAGLVIAVALSTLNGALNLIDSPYAWKNQVAAWRWAFNQSGRAQVARGSGQAAEEATIEVLPNGYQPNEVTLAAGKPVSLILTSAGQLGCTSVFLIPKLGVSETLQPGRSTRLSLKLASPGSYTFTCGMGMYSGTIHAV